MSRAEMAERFDRIVDFAGVGRFIDTPVKRYSSGMQLRLAFAVAAHIEPEILLVDEVLAVGDAEFKAKCMGKMDEVASRGRTIIFVSHDLGAVSRLCPRTLLLADGGLAADGNTGEVIGDYLKTGVQSSYENELASEAAIEDGVAVESIVVVQDGVSAPTYLDSASDIEVTITYRVTRDIDALLAGFDLVASDGTRLWRTYDLESIGVERAPGRYRSTSRIPANTLRAGRHTIELLLALHRERWLSRDRVSVALDVHTHDEPEATYMGVVGTLSRWRVDQIDDARTVAPADGTGARLW